MKDSVIYLLYKLLKKNKIAIDEEEVKFQLLSHPTYPSLHSITGVLDHFAIENIAAKIPTDSETLSQLNSYTLTQIRNETGEHFVIFIKKKNTINLIFSREYKQTLSIEEFLKVWTGVILIIDPNENSKTNTSNKEPKYRTAVSFFLVIILLGSFLLLKPELTAFIHYLLSFSGLLFSALIVSKELGIQSSTVNKFCNKEQKNIDCDAVLNSKGATLFNKLKLSDISIVYFGTLIISSLLILLNDNSSIDLIYLISISAIPFTVYSIFYQYKIIKNWCLLCISISLILWLQAITIYFTNFDIKELTFDSYSFGFTLISFLLISTAWSYVIPLLKNEIASRKLKIEHFKFKRNYTLFNTLLSESEILPTKLIDKKEIILGNKTEKPELSITVITNPLCGHCKEVHLLIDNILKNYKKEVQIIVRFNIPNIHSENESTKIAARLTELFNDEGEERCKLAMSKIYLSSAPNDWLKTYGNFSNDNYLNLLKKQHQWCVSYDKNFTPEILLNGKSYPNAYNRKELLFFVEDLITQN
ncbi:vitamin K epoxide reductase family protein [uncultured Aquimarina sp.]|uniref:vitamin K epoxide reductase family protein n=1 Tax=uncultured Aquimarina sp. TaxID=575652 RepID=UPI00262E9609|nr:vitamin K epoxide reductase family protein [uncultured Aquimarina sp.]